LAPHERGLPLIKVNKRQFVQCANAMGKTF
jgi:hypothetical protein